MASSPQLIPGGTTPVSPSANQEDPSALPSSSSGPPQEIGSIPPNAASGDFSNPQPSLHETEANALLSWVKAVHTTRALQLTKIGDLTDGSALFEVLATVDATHFLNPHAQTAYRGGEGENYALKLGTLKRLFKLIMQYYNDTLLLSPPPYLSDVDLNEVARSPTSIHALCKLCKLAIGIAIQSERTKAQHVLAIQTLSQEDQQSLMLIIEDIMRDQSSIASPITPSFDKNLSQSEFMEESPEIRRLRLERQEAEKLYLSLLEEHQALNIRHEDLQTEKEELVKDLERLQAERETSKTSGAEAVLKFEVETLKARLRKSEDDLAEAEGEVERLTALESESSKKLTELQVKADDAARLKDQVDEYKHLAERVQRTENANEKYRKKLEETAGIRRQLKELEDQNSELIDRNAALEKDYAKVAEYKPLVDNYKAQIDDLTRRNGAMSEEAATLRYNAQQTAMQVKSLEEARAKDAEEIELYREKVEELELGITGSSKGSRGKKGTAGDAGDGDIDDELEDALHGTTKTDLKLRIHQLSRDLKSARASQGEGSRVLVLENLLEDSQRSRKKYEEDYWTQYRLRLKLSSDLDKIRNAEGGRDPDGPEVAHALRIRLNEVTAELDEVRSKYAELSVEKESGERELARARTDLSLVDKEKLEMLASLRATLKGENEDLERKVADLQIDLRSAQEREKSLTSQIQGLLMDKIALMEGGGGAGEREAALRREKALDEYLASSSSSSSSSKALPIDVQETLLSLTTKNQELQKRVDEQEEKMRKVKSFIRQQDRLLQEARKASASSQTVSAVGGGDSIGSDGGESNADADADGKSNVATEEKLRKELSELKQEQTLLLYAFRHLASTRVHGSFGALLPPSTSMTIGSGSGSGSSGSASFMGSGSGRSGSGATTQRLGSAIHTRGSEGLAGAGAGMGPSSRSSWLGLQERNRVGVSWLLGRR